MLLVKQAFILSNQQVLVFNPDFPFLEPIMAFLVVFLNYYLWKYHWTILSGLAAIAPTKSSIFYFLGISNFITSKVQVSMP